jgi:hypothetical protein
MRAGIVGLTTVKSLACSEHNSLLCKEYNYNNSRQPVVAFLKMERWKWSRNGKGTNLPGDGRHQIQAWVAMN